MNKAQSYRQHITDNVAEIKKHPDKLNVFVEKGNLVARNGSPHFEYRYEINIIVLDYSLHPDTLMFPTLQWIAVNQPAIFQNPDLAENAINFESEVIDNTRYDISINFKVTEAVRVTNQNNTITLEHLEEPALEDAGVYPWQLYANSQLQVGN